MRNWINAVLGPRALALVDGGEGGGVVGLAEGLKDGRVLVRLAHAVGGVRTAGMGEVRIAALPGVCRGVAAGVGGRGVVGGVGGMLLFAQK